MKPICTSKASENSPMVAGESVKLVVIGYVPPSQNAIRGCHWSVLHREKRRAAICLKFAIESRLRFTVSDPSTGTTTDLKTFKIALSKLDCYLEMIGAFLKGESCLTRPLPKRKSEQK